MEALLIAITLVLIFSTEIYLVLVKVRPQFQAIRLSITASPLM